LLVTAEAMTSGGLCGA